MNGHPISRAIDMGCSAPLFIFTEKNSCINPHNEL